MNPRMVQPAKEAWPFSANGELARVLVERQRELINFFYTICNIPSYPWHASTLGFRDESSSRNLAEGITDLVVPLTSLILPLPPSALPQPKVMDIKALFENAQQDMDIVALNAQAGSSNYKRLKPEKRSFSVMEGDGNKLPDHFLYTT
ncbi:hypothetical protein J1N35_005347 [Gossypium stocksii]|uniref:Uncharacterized protein n=1 Tax=Gossypium stocksii TaxID=47602 RepID=A0A9D3WDN7_9ROSI|nr:hypothetical protein J1N35_005347 [Gossypium stocksii]